MPVATIPATDEGALSLAALNRMIEGALRGVAKRSGIENRESTTASCGA